MAQTNYLRRALAERGYSECRSERTPASTGPLSTAKGEAQLAKEAAAAAKAEADPDSSEAPRITAATFSSVLGTFMYASNCTRPDITHALNHLARYSVNPSTESVLELRRIARYLSGTLEMGLVYSPSGSNQLDAYCDSDWGGCTITRKSTSGFALMLGGAAIHWASKRQPSVALSTAEAEYIAMGEADRSIMHCRQLLTHMGMHQSSATMLYCDSQAAIAISKADSVAPRRKHIDVKHHFIREQIHAGVIQPQWISTLEQPADIFTKALPVEAFIQHREFITNSKQASSSGGGSKVSQAKAKPSLD